jgi:hypothetical protein
MAIEKDHGKSEMYESGVVLSGAIPASEHALVLVEPGEEALDLPAAPVSAQRATVLSRTA